MLHLNRGIIRFVSAVWTCMVFGIDCHARIAAISTLSKNGGKADAESVPDAMCPHEAPLIFAGKPTASLDARNRKMVAYMLLGQTARGASVVHATHDLALAQACTAVIEL